MKSKPRVFLIAENQRFNTQAAEAFGKRVFLFEGREPNPFDVEKLQIEVLRRLVKHWFNPKLDYIVLTGSSVQTALFLGIVAGEYLNKSSIRILIFDARSDSYQSKRVNQRPYQSEIRALLPEKGER